MRRTAVFFIALGVAVAVCAAWASSSEAKPKGPKVLRSGKILFGAHGTTNGQAPFQLFVSDAKGSDLTQISGWLVTGGEDYSTPDIGKAAGGGWRIAWGVDGIHIFDTATGAIVGNVNPGTRADFSSDANTIVYQSGTTENNISKASYDGSNVTQLTFVTSGNNAEWPYFVPQTGRILFFSTFGLCCRHIMDADGSNEQVIAWPGGDTVSHLGMKSDGSEFVNPDNLTSYLVSSGAVGTINDLKNTTTLLSQLSSLGFEEVPSTIYHGQGGAGTFALSVDWSEDGEKLVFDALVEEQATGQYGIAIFVFDLTENKLSLVYGPEPLEPSRTNNYNYSIHTPKWIP